MPSPYINKLSKETGKSVDEIEKLWAQAKEITSDTFGKPESDFGSKEYKYTVGIVKNMLGVNEKILDPTIFLSSGKSAKEFIHETVTSANFTVGDVNPVHPSKDANDGEEEADSITYDNFPGADEGDFEAKEQLEVPQGSADIGDFLTDLNTDLRENSPEIDPENPEDLRSIEDSDEENTDGVVLPPDEYYDQFDLENDLS